MHGTAGIFPRHTSMRALLSKPSASDRLMPSAKDAIMVDITMFTCQHGNEITHFTSATLERARPPRGDLPPRPSGRLYSTPTLRYKSTSPATQPSRVTRKKPAAGSTQEQEHTPYLGPGGGLRANGNTSHV